LATNTFISFWATPINILFYTSKKGNTNKQTTMKKSIKKERGLWNRNIGKVDEALSKIILSK
jgi:hypothetical protein